MSSINSAIAKLTRRAEKYDSDHIVSTFVDVGPLYSFLQSNENQILYGRRGTGKSHVLYYLKNHVESKKDIPIFIDMRIIGSTGGIYSDHTIPIEERATRLLIDTFTEIHEQLLDFVTDRDTDVDSSVIVPHLDELADSITQLQVVGEVEKEEIIKQRRVHSEGFNANVQTKGYTPNIGVGYTNNEELNKGNENRLRKTGVEKHSIHFGSVQRILRRLIRKLKDKKIWILLDEWSEIPIELQPFLSDLVRRTLFPSSGFIVKIAAIEKRCQFRINNLTTGYVGIEVGADTGASINIDEYMVFDNDKEAAKSFFQGLLYKHIKPYITNTDVDVNNSVQLINAIFTQKSAFDELVRAAEGVPRDFLNVLGASALKANTRKISVDDVRDSARNWYNRDKESAVNFKPQAQHLLRYIIDEVIGHRKARAFLLRSDMKHNLIDYLYDARILHVVKQNISGRDQPGARFNVYGIDYGCYVDLINTSKAPQGLFAIDNLESEEEDVNDKIYIEVPENDYRSIRRAILDIEKIEKEL